MSHKQQLIEIRPGRTIAIDLYHGNTEKHPTLFFIHGSSGSPSHWRHILPELQQRFNCVVPTLLGHGKSQAPKFTLGEANPYDFMEIAKDIKLLVEKYGDANGNNILIGHSRGAMLATHLAYTYPSLMHSMILLCPDTFNDRPESNDMWNQPIADLEAIRPQMEEVFEYIAFCSKTSPEIIKQETAAARQIPMHVVQGMKLGKPNLVDIDFSKIMLPTLTLSGDSDLLISNDKVKASYGKMPNNKLTVIKDAGHLLMLEQPLDVMHKINEFLKTNII